MGKHSRLPEAQAAAVQARRPQVRYYAFLSYSHEDAELAEWLHCELEEFRVPPSLAGKLTDNGVVPKRLTPIFRDQHELAAADDLGDEIVEALAASQFLIVLCSPAAAKSHWTNAEIEMFKRVRPDGCALAVIASGEPFASEAPGRQAEECFPPALRQKFDRRGRPTGKRAEPLAADLRHGGELRRLGFLKLVAGMLGVGLDDLVQRETTRRHRRLAWLAAASLAGMAITSTLAFTAVRARDEAREQRREAEGLVSFMLGDLKDKLEPIGRLDALDGVGGRVLAYYSKQNARELSDSALIQRARALSLMGQVAYLRGKMPGAVRLYKEAAGGSAEAVSRQPQDPQRLFDHAQNIFWLAAIAGEQGDLKRAESGYREYKTLASRMVSIAPDNMKWRMEEQYADANLGVVLYKQRRFAEAGSQFEQLLGTVQALADADRRNAEYQKSLAGALAWLADARMSEGKFDQAIAIRQRQLALLEQRARTSSDVAFKGLMLPAEQALGRLFAMRGQNDLANRYLTAAVDRSRELRQLEPDNTVWLESAFSAEFALADFALTQSAQAAARPHTAAGCAIVDGLLHRDSSYPQWRGGRRDCELLKARTALASKDSKAALAGAENALEAARSVHSNDRAADRFALAKVYRVMGDIRRSEGNAPEAAAAWSNALGAIPKNAAERPSEMNEHALVLHRLGRDAEAAQLTAKLNAMGYRRTW